MRTISKRRKKQLAFLKARRDAGYGPGWIHHGIRARLCAAAGLGPVKQIEMPDVDLVFDAPY